MSRRGPRWTEELLDELAKRRRLLIVLDYDGTLVTIRSHPNFAKLGRDERATLRRLNRGHDRVAMMSGRSIADIRERVRIPDLIYGGVFGLEIVGPNLNYIHPLVISVRPALAALAQSLRRLLTDVPGLRVEDKHGAVCVHYRAVPPERRQELERRLAHARAAAPRGLRWRRGRRAWEVMPQTDWDKGMAVKLLWRKFGRPTLLIIGDEHFDESMLRVAYGRGAGLRVGRGHTEASRRLRNPIAVRRFLKSLAERRELRLSAKRLRG